MEKKTLLLLRGLPGSGKSTFAAFLKNSSGFQVFALDDFFTNEKGEYQFDFKTNHLAYKHCQSQVTISMERRIEKIIVDQTFASLWEIEPYLNLAKLYDYQIFVCTMENRHNGNNVHSISDEQLMKMSKGFKIELLPERLRER